MIGSGIYLITNRINGKQYVGQSINLIKRWNQHKTESRRNVPRTIIDKALKKYGIENFDFDIILECDLDMLDKWETDMINLYDCVRPKGYNVNPTGRGLSDSTKRLLSYRMKENNPMKDPDVVKKVSKKLKGVKHNRVTDYQRQVTSKRMKENNPMKDPDVAKKVSENRKGKRLSLENIIKGSKYVDIKQFDKDGRYIKTWKLVSDIEKELHIDHCGIYACLNGKLRTSGGYIWRCI